MSRFDIAPEGARELIARKLQEEFAAVAEQAIVEAVKQYEAKLRQMLAAKVIALHDWYSVHQMEGRLVIEVKTRQGE